MCRKWALGENFDKEIVKFVQFFKDQIVLASLLGRFPTSHRELKFCVEIMH
jgi:hypothetical protein